MDETAINVRVVNLLEGSGQRGLAEWHERIAGTMTLLSAVYGENSPQQQTLVNVLKSNGPDIANIAAIGQLRNLKSELQAGLVGSLRLTLTGGVLGDLLVLARELFDENPSRFKIPAVLAAAAFEDTLRRLAREKSGVDDRRKLGAVIEELRTHRVVTDAQNTIAVGHLKLRNDALHGDWEQIERASVASMLAFTEEMILKHFG